MGDDHAIRLDHPNWNHGLGGRRHWHRRRFCAVLILHSSCSWLIQTAARCRTGIRSTARPSPETAGTPSLDRIRHDLRRVPLEVRKATLASTLARAGPGIRFSEHIEAEGPTVFAHACKMGLEGIVSKRKDSRYRSGHLE
jgi:hypothetical protein